MKNLPRRLTLNKPHPRTQIQHTIFLALSIILVLAFQEKALGNDIISGYNSLIFRSYSDLTFKGINGVREEVDNDHYTFYDLLNIRQIRLHQSDGLRVFGSGSGWLRLDFGDKAFDSQTKADLIYTCAGCHDNGADTICVQCHATIAKGGLGINPHPRGFHSRLGTTRDQVCLECHVK